MLEKEFARYQEALVLKELGFDEPCFAFFNGKHLSFERFDILGNPLDICNCLEAPTYSQIFRFFREKYNLLGSIDYSNRLKWYYVIREFITSDILPNLNTSSKGEFESYEEAELECLVKLIDIVKKQNYLGLKS